MHDRKSLLQTNWMLQKTILRQGDRMQPPSQIGILMIIRKEMEHDREAVRNVTIEAFESSEFGYNQEAELIDLIRTQTQKHVSLVAEFESKVVGHILFSPVQVVSENATIEGMGLGPLSVAVSQQNYGIGQRLVMTGLHELELAACPFVVVLGHPDYYSRFGFSPASHFGIQHGFDGIPQQVFFVLANPESAATPINSGRAYYLPAFGPQH